MAGIQGLASSEQARRVTDWGREMGDGRAEGSLAIGGGGQAAVSFTVDVAGADSVSLLDSSLFQFVSVTQSCPTLCHPMNRSTPGLPVHHQLPEFTQTHVH